MSCPTNNNNNNSSDIGRGIIVEEVGGKTSSRGDLSDLDSTFFDQPLPLLLQGKMMSNKHEEEYNITLTLFLYGLMDRYLGVAH